MHVRNHLIFSCTQPAGSATPHLVFEYTNALGCILVPIKPLQEQKEDIISSAGLYINTLNQELGRQVVGVDDEAAALLEQYDYPYNRTQFKRILKEAVIRTEGPYICAQTIQEVIRREDVLFSGFPFPAQASSAPSKKDADTAPGNARLPVPHPSPFCLDTSQSLDEMNRDIVHYVLNTCGGNQTSAAKKLGISRTTLWRYLNR
nr:helix-turn-helix domain-containing protein [Enterocloster clostridioformis]